MSTIAEVSSAINIRADIVAQNGVVVAARIGDMNAELCVAEDDVASALVVPPIVFPEADEPIRTPWIVFGTAAVSLASVPM